MVAYDWGYDEKKMREDMGITRDEMRPVFDLFPIAHALGYSRAAGPWLWGLSRQTLGTGLRKSLKVWY